MNKVFFKIIRRSLVVFLMVIIIMAFLALESYTYIVGWAAGSFASVFGFSLSFLITKKFKNNLQAKAQAFWLGLGRSLVVLVFHGFYLWVVMIGNTYFSNQPLFNPTTSTIINPINFFTYLFGILLIPIGTISLAIPNWRKGS